MEKLFSFCMLLLFISAIDCVRCGHTYFFSPIGRYLLQPEEGNDIENAGLFAEYFTQINPQQIKKAPDQYILCLSFWDLKHLLNIKPNMGTFLNEIYMFSYCFIEIVYQF
ncbi:MAG: hypothetical protein R6U96_01835 [Promethearchaeia archaeon]